MAQRRLLVPSKAALDHVDPPDLALRPTLRRLFPLWWEQRRLAGLGLACALAFTALSITIPILIKNVIDEAIVGPHDGRLLPYLGIIVVLATLRFGVNFARRFATARVGIAVEARLRGMLYHAYLTYPRAFFDRHATGEVISRATNDIYPVRYFIGWGVVQGVQSAMMITGAAIVLTARERTARALRRARDAPDRRPDLVLRAQALPDLAPRPGEEGPPRGGDRRGGRRDRDGAGVRPRGRRADTLPRPRRGGTPRDDAGGVRGGVLPPRPPLPAVARDCRRAPLRRARGDRRPADDRRVHALHHAAAPARLAARGARLDHQPRPACGCVGGAKLRVAGRDRAARRAGRAEAAPGRAAAGALRGRSLRVRDRGRGAPWRRPCRRAG